MVFIGPGDFRHALLDMTHVMYGGLDCRLVQLEMKVPKACVKLCQKQYNAKEMKLFRQLINEEYRVHWYGPGRP